MAFRDDPGAGYGPLDFDLDADPARLAFMGAIYNADDPDLSAFRDAGGRLLIWHGWADAIVTPWRTLAYFAAAQEAAGGAGAAADFVRLFMVPGMDHCGLLPGPGIDQSGFDPLAALEAWVEDGTAPDRLPSVRTDADGTVTWSRPLCPYPQEARYVGQGDPTDAASFVCAAP
jgi:feruloyl esterase